MAASGCLGVAVGVESMDDNNCAAVSKYQNLQQPFTDAVHHANQLGIQTIALILVLNRTAVRKFSMVLAFAAATVIYLLTNLVVVLAMRALEKKVRVPGLISASASAGAH